MDSTYGISQINLKFPKETTDESQLETRGALCRAIINGLRLWAPKRLYTGEEKLFLRIDLYVNARAVWTVSSYNGDEANGACDHWVMIHGGCERLISLP
jgi:hypothetical protein